MSSITPTLARRRGPAFPRLPDSLRAASRALADLETHGAPQIDEELAAKRAAEQALQDAAAAKEKRRIEAELEERLRVEAIQRFQQEAGHYKQRALSEHIATELPKLQKAVRSFLITYRALGGPYRPNDSRWWLNTMVDMNENRTMNAQVVAMQRALEDFIRG